jgi:signal transduction histidine kinase
MKQTIYRIMQEALANAARHSSAEHVEISLEFHENSITLFIQDDGIGFDTELQYGGMGLQSMLERAEYLGGQLVIHSKHGEGTRVCVTLPIEGEGG